MTQTAILEEIKKLSAKERLEIIESAIHQLQEDFQKIKQPLTQLERKQELAAAEALLSDYEKDDELTSFTALDGEGFHA